MNKLTVWTEILLLTFVLLLTACGGSGGGAVNNAPVATDSGVSLLPGSSVTGNLTASDIDANDLTFSIVAYPGNGAVSITDTATGAYSYTHDGTANGDSFTFWVNDGLLDSNIATVTVTTTVADAPASGLVATAGDERITLSWDAVAGADSYNVYWFGTPGTGTGGTQILNVTSPYYHNVLTNDTAYYYVVTAVNAVGESVASAEQTAIPVDILISDLSFTDGTLSLCVSNTAAVLPAPVYVHHLTYLDCSNGAPAVASLTGIEALTSLTDLYLHNNSISDVGPLSGLTGLTLLFTGGNSITDVSSLSGLTSLTSLNLNSNSITDVDPLSGLTSLTYLNLFSNSITDVSPLSGLTGLTFLNLYDNSITDVTPLSGLISLTNLQLLYNNITDVTPLSGLTNLTFLHLSNNNIIDVNPLSSLTDLTVLHLDNNSIGGLGIGNVDDLTTLTNAEIYLDGNTGMSCSELATLITMLSSPPVDTDGIIGTTDVATNDVNCTGP